MKEYKGLIPEIEIKLKHGKVHKMKLRTSSDSASAFRYFFNEDTLELYEQFMVIFLNQANTTIGWFKVSQGGITGTIMDPRLIFATALKMCATGMVLCHNHPSGNLSASENDIKNTKQMKQIGDFHNIAIIDHIILSESSYYSMADEGII